MSHNYVLRVDARVTEDDANNLADLLDHLRALHLRGGFAPWLEHMSVVLVRGEPG